MRMSSCNRNVCCAVGLEKKKKKQRRVRSEVKNITFSFNVCALTFLSQEIFVSLCCGKTVKM